MGSLTDFTHLVRERHKITHRRHNLLHGDGCTDVQTDIGLQSAPCLIEGRHRTLGRISKGLHLQVAGFYLLSQFIESLLSFFGGAVHALQFQTALLYGLLQLVVRTAFRTVKHFLNFLADGVDAL